MGAPSLRKLFAAALLLLVAALPAQSVPHGAPGTGANGGGGGGGGGNVSSSGSITPNHAATWLDSTHIQDAGGVLIDAATVCLLSGGVNCTMAGSTRYPISVSGGNTYGQSWVANLSDPPGVSGLFAPTNIAQGVTGNPFHSGHIDEVVGWYFNTAVAGGTTNPNLWQVQWVQENSYHEVFAPYSWTVEWNADITLAGAVNYVRPYLMHWRLGPNGDGVGGLNGQSQFFSGKQLIGTTRRDGVTACTNGGANDCSNVIAFGNRYDKRMVFNYDSGADGPGQPSGAFNLYQAPQYALYSGTASAGTTTTLVDAGQGWADGTWGVATNVAYIVSGDCAGQYRSIADTTGGDTLTVSPAWTDSSTDATLATCSGGAPDNTSVYQILTSISVTGTVIDNRAKLVTAGGPYKGLHIINNFDSTTRQEGPGNLWGLQIDNIFSGSTAQRQIGHSAGTLNGQGDITGLQINTGSTATGTNNDLGNMFGIDLTMSYGGTESGDGMGVGYGIFIRTPAGSTVTPNNTAAIYIDNQGNRAQNGYADTLFVETQTSGSGYRSNIRLNGGHFNDGHIMLGPDEASAVHLYRDAAGFLRVEHGLSIDSNSFPSTDTHGQVAVTGTQSSNYGPAVWAVMSAADGCAAAGTTDTTPSCPREVCSNMGMLCVSSRDLNADSTVAIGCTAEDTGGVFFATGTTMLVLCK